MANGRLELTVRKSSMKAFRIDLETWQSALRRAEYDADKDPSRRFIFDQLIASAATLMYVRIHWCDPIWPGEWLG